MLSSWPIRYKLTFGLILLLVIVLTLAVSGFQGVYAYRGLVKDVARTSELSLSQHVGDLRVTLGQARRLQDGILPPTEGLPTEGLPTEGLPTEGLPIEAHLLREQFRTQFHAVRETLERYETQLDARQLLGQPAYTYDRERETVRKLKQSLRLIEQLGLHEDWVIDNVAIDRLNVEAANLQKYSGELTGYLRDRLNHFAADVSSKYRMWIVLAWTTSTAAGLMLAALLLLFWKWIFQPLRIVIRESRRIAEGDFDHRIYLPTRDEMSSLANALNEMTERFQTIRNDLDSQVKQRTREVVRSERLASVGFLATGVAHEINNPLASVALCVESLTDRIDDILAAKDRVDEQVSEELTEMRGYLQMIQSETFRCKDITEKLLDFSRLGDVEFQRVDIRELVLGVVDMVRYLARYRDKDIAVASGNPVILEVNPQEVKQVVLNVLTNALGSIDPGGLVNIELEEIADKAEIVVKDNGCGMTAEVIEHLFEPFFTRRRDGQGTGLGMAISYRIVADHGGHIEATSGGPGQGATFRVTLPKSQGASVTQQKNTQAG